MIKYFRELLQVLKELNLKLDRLDGVICDDEKRGKAIYVREYKDKPDS